MEGQALLRRVVYTLGLALVPVLGSRIPLPGVDWGMAPEAEGAVSSTSVFALGVGPLLSAYLTVEVVALLVPRWNKLRHGSVAGRARLERAVWLLALALATTQAFGMVMMLSHPELGALDDTRSAQLLVMLSVLAATSLLMLVAREIDRQGLVNGLVALTLISSAAGLVSGLSPQDLPTEPVLQARVGFGLVLPLLATWCVVRGASATGSGPWVSVPASSLQPVSTSYAVLGAPALLMHYGVPGLEGLSSALVEHAYEFGLGIGLLLVLLFSYLLHQPGKVTASLGNPLAPALRATFAEVHGALIRALWPSAALITSLLVANQLLQGSRLPWRPAADLALFAALCLDGAGALRRHARDATLVCVGEERRPYLLPLLQEAAQQRGLTLVTTGVALTSLLRFFGPFAAIRIWCPPAQAEQVRALLTELYAAERQEAERDPVAESAPEAAPSQHQAVRAPRGIWLLVLALAAGVVGVETLQLPERGISAVIEAVPVDDTVDPFEALQGELPSGVSTYMEAVGPEGQDQVRFLRLVARADESLPVALKRIEPWLQGLQLPADTRLVWEAVDVLDEQTGELTREAWRSYLARGPSFVGRGDFVAATPEHDGRGGWAVGLKLSPDASRRFERATSELLQRRFALLIDGEVQMVPKVMGVISGPYVKLSMGSTDPERARAEAERLVKRLTR